jgi:hypothetical protein
MAKSVSNVLPAVVTETFAELGATQFHQTDFPPALPA